MAASDHLPSVDDVAALVRARTRDTLGTEIGTFTANTRPTATQVSLLIANEASIVLLRTGSMATMPCPDAAAIRDGAQSVIAKRVAAIIEASYRPDELAEGRTVEDFYSGDREADVAALADAASKCRLWTADEFDDEALRAAEWYFPPAVPLRW